MASNTVIAQNPKPRWEVQINGKKKPLILKKGQAIGLVYRGGPDSIAKTEGSLLLISQDSFLLKKGKSITAVAKHDIYELHKKQGFLALFGGVAIMVIGIFLAGFLLLLQTISNSTRTDRQLAAGEKTSFLPSIIGVGIIALFGIGLLIATREKRYLHPFAETPIQIPGKVKSNEMP